MATNLVSVVMQFLTPDMIAKIASVLGLDRNVAQKAIAGAIPALLASLADVASTPNGARQLTNTLTQQSGSLESLKNLVGGAGQNLLAETGSSMLSGLFGGGTLDTMAQTIGKFAGIGEGTSKSMLGMLGPVVLGALGQQQRSAGSRRRRAGVPSHFTEGSDRRGNTVRSRRSVECRRSHRRSDWKLAQRCGGSQRGWRPNCGGFGADRFRAGQAASAAARTTRHHNGRIGWSPRWYWVVSPGSPLVVQGRTQSLRCRLPPRRGPRPEPWAWRRRI